MKLSIAPFLLRLAPFLARTRRIVPYPGWYFDIEWSKRDLIHKVRRRIWLYCNHHKAEHRIVMRWHQGTRVFVYLGNDMSKQLFLAGCNEPNETAFVNQFLKPGMTFLDIGANDGLYTLLAATRVGATGRVLSFEPSQREYDRLTANVRLNNLQNVELFRAAVFRYETQVEILIAGYENEGHNTIGKFIYPNTQHLRTERVSAHRLDTITKQQNLQRVDMIKIDAEGAELAILQGALEMLQRFRPYLLMEWNEPALMQQNGSVEEIKNILQSCQYDVYHFDEMTGLPAPAKGTQYSPNVLAVPRERQYS